MPLKENTFGAVRNLDGFREVVRSRQRNVLKALQWEICQS
jgi:hypothetical protein